MKEVYIGSIIRKRRQELGLTQEQLCRGICETVTLSRIENGKQTPSRSKLNALLQRLGMPGERYYALLSEQEMKISNLQTEIVSCNVLGQREQGLKKLDELERMMEADGISLHIGDEVSYGTVYRIGEIMSDLLYQWLCRKDNRLLSAIITPGSSELKFDKSIRAICFSGGVADCIYHPSEGTWARYGDMGVVLGEAIRAGRLFSDFRVIEAKETIRATVVGAGSYTTSVSGSTITYNRDVFPLKNIPVLKLNENEQQDCFAGQTEGLMEKLRWMQAQSDSKQLILAMKGKKNPSYMEVKRLAASLVSALDALLPGGQPMLIVLECDMAKALGQMMMQLSTRHPRDVICIDSVQVEQNDFVDMGKPLVNGLVIPVVVKTLIFG